MMTYIDEYMYLDEVEPIQLDKLLARAWRHFGISFYRYSVSMHSHGLCHVVPLRIRLADFSLSRSQRRILARNGDLEVVVRPSGIDQEKADLFARHKQRFRENVPASIYDFMSPVPASVPCRNDEIRLHREGVLLGVSFLDIGHKAASAVYAMFEPAESARSLGIQLILSGIDYAKRLNLQYYYLGYAYQEPSFYDYKKRFSALEAFDWVGGWRRYGREDGPRGGVE